MIESDLSTDIKFVTQNVIENIGFSTISPSKIHGFGLYATKDIHANQILGTLDGQVIDWNKYDEITNALKSSLHGLNNFIFMEWNALNTTTLLVRAFRTKYSFINHSYTPNLEIQYNPMRVVTIREICAGEEYTLDYSKEPLRQEYIEGHGKTYL